MVDRVSKEKRSEIMSRIRSKNTKMEVAVKGKLQERGLWFVYQPKIQGHPDFLVLGKGMVVAVRLMGCFWHGCPDHYSEPKSNVEFWRQKVLRNKARDQKTKSILQMHGIRVLDFWEHEVEENIEAVVSRIESSLKTM